MKTFQILLVVSAMLCAAGIAPTLLGERDTDVPEDYKPPAWISVLDSIASEPAGAREGLRQGRRPAPAIEELPGD